MLTQAAKQATKECAIVGSGIMGLRVAVELALKGYRPTIFTHQKISETTTVVAGAIWMPYKAYPEHKVLQWAKASLDYYRDVEKIVESGVVWRTHTEFFPTAVSRPAWMQLLSKGDTLQCAIPKEAVCYHSAKLPVIDTRRLVAYHSALLDQFEIKSVAREIHHLCEDLQAFDVIINASGAGARRLAADEMVYPIKG